MDKDKKHKAGKNENFIKIFDLLPKDNVTGGSGKIVFGEVSHKTRKRNQK